MVDNYLDFLEFITLEVIGNTPTHVGAGFKPAPTLFIGVKRGVKEVTRNHNGNPRRAN